MLPPSLSKVAEQTARQIHKSLRPAADRSVMYYASHPAELERRLEELSEEWTIESILETSSSAGSLLGLTLGYARSWRWYLLPLALHEFVLQHALLGRCPSLPIVGRLGFRSRKEIAHERRALEAIRVTGQMRPSLVVEVKDFQVRPWAVRRIASIPLTSGAEVTAAA